MIKRYREKILKTIPSTIEELIPFLTKTHADLLQEGARQIQYNLGTSIEYGEEYGQLEISYYSEETKMEKAERERRVKERERREREQYEQLRKKFEEN